MKMADAPGRPPVRERRKSQMLEHPGEQHGEAGAAASTRVRRPPSRSSGSRRLKAADNAEASGSAVLATTTSSASDTTATGGAGAAAGNATSPAIPDQPAQATIAATVADVDVGESAAAGTSLVPIAGTPDAATAPVVDVAQAAVGAMAPGNELHNCRAGDNESLDPPPGISIEIALVQFPPPRPTEGVHNRAPDKTSFRPQWNCFHWLMNRTGGGR